MMHLHGAGATGMMHLNSDPTLAQGLLISRPGVTPCQTTSASTTHAVRIVLLTVTFFWRRAC